MKFEIFSRSGLLGRRWYFRLRAKNGEIVAQSQRYKQRESAVETIGRIIRETEYARIEEVLK